MEIKTLLQGIYGTEPLPDHLGHGMLVYDFDVVKDLHMKLLIKIVPMFETISLRLTDFEPVPEEKVRPVTELLSRLNLMSRVNHLTLNPKNHWIYLHQGIFLERGKFSARDLHQALTTLMSHASVFFPSISEFISSDISVKELARRIEQEDHPGCFLGPRID